MKTIVLLSLFALPAFAADPPDWYAHIGAEQRAALLAARHAGPAGSLIGVGSPATYRGPMLVAYAAPHFDLTTIGASNLSLEHHRERAVREQMLLRAWRQPDVHFSLTWRGVRCWNERECRHWQHNPHQFK